MSICITTVRAEGEFVQIVKDDRLVFELPWQAALDLAKAIHGKAKECEEFACRDTIIHDQAIVTRLGLRFGLTSNPHMLKEEDCARNDALLARVIPHFVTVPSRCETR